MNTENKTENNANAQTKADQVAALLAQLMALTGSKNPEEIVSAAAAEARKTEETRLDKVIATLPGLFSLVDDQADAGAEIKGSAVKRIGKLCLRYAETGTCAGTAGSMDNRGRTPLAQKIKEEMTDAPSVYVNFSSGDGGKDADRPLNRPLTVSEFDKISAALKKADGIASVAHKSVLKLASERVVTRVKTGAITRQTVEQAIKDAAQAAKAAELVTTGK